MSNIGIVGWGVVGQATGRGFSSKHTVTWHDPYKEEGVSLEELILNSEFIFVCVPTPMFADYSGIDLSIVEEVVGTLASKIANTDKILVIKSTVIPGTTARFQSRYADTLIANNPEFLTEARPFEDFLNPDRTIIGGETAVCQRIRKVYEEILPENAVYFLTDTTSAELAKYMSNTLLAAKVMLAYEYYILAQRLGADYEQVRIMTQADPRIGGHLRVPGPDGDVGFGGKCLPKDLVALLSLGKDLGVLLPLLEDTWKENLKVRNNRDWEEIRGAVSKKEI